MGSYLLERHVRAGWKCRSGCNRHRGSMTPAIPNQWTSSLELPLWAILADIDANGEVDALTDGLLILRYLFGLEGDTLINGVVAGDATRKTAEEIEAHLETLMPAL